MNMLEYFHLPNKVSVVSIRAPPLYVTKLLGSCFLTTKYFRTYVREQRTNQGYLQYNRTAEILQLSSCIYSNHLVVAGRWPCGARRHGYAPQGHVNMKNEQHVDARITLFAYSKTIETHCRR